MSEVTQAAVELLRTLGYPAEGPGSDVLVARAVNLVEQFREDAQRLRVDLKSLVCSTADAAPDAMRRGLY